MIELRWIVPESTTTEAPRLQYRTRLAVDASGAFCPGAVSEWKFVPTEVIPRRPINTTYPTTP